MAVLSLGVTSGVILALLATVALALVTAPGHRFVQDLGLKALRNSINGTVTVGSLSGALWRAADLRDIVIADSTGQQVIKAERLRATFAVTDLVRGRFRFSKVSLVRPVVVLEQDRQGHWNIEGLFRKGARDSTQPPGRRPLVELRDVVLTDGTVILRERPGPRRDRVRQRTFTGLTAGLERLRASHPDSTGVAAEFRTMAVRIDDPVADVRDARGRATLDGDSLRFNLRNVVLPNSEADVVGVVRFGGPHTGIEASVSASRFAFADIKGLVPRAPEEGGGRGDVRILMPGDGSGVIEIQDGELRSGRSVVIGRGTVIIGRRGGVTLRGVEASLQPLDLALLEPYVDSLPVHGLVTGRASASGSMRDVAVNASVTWHDEDAPGTPANMADLRGRLSLGGTDQLVFRNVTLRGADFDLRTIRRFAPSVELEGRLRAAGTLDGPWRAALLNGALDHSGSGLTSSVFGEVRLGLADTVRVDAELRVDSLSFALLRRTYPQIPLRDDMRGYIGLHGPLTALTVNAALYGPPGTFTAAGTVGVHDDHVTVEGEGIYDSLDVSRLVPGAPPSALWGHWRTSLRVPTDSGQPATGTARADLTRGRLGGSTLLAGETSLRLEPSRIEVEFARLGFIGGTASVSGAVGRGSAASSSIAFDLRADTVGYLEPILRWARQEAGDSSGVRLDGAAFVTGRLAGTTTAWALDADALLTSVDVAGSQGRNLRARGHVDFRKGEGYSLRVDGSADTLATAGLVYSPVGVALSGRPDSLSIRANAGFLSRSAIRAAFTVWGDTARSVRAESLEIDLPAHRWRLMRPATAVIDTGVIQLDTVILRSVTGSGYIEASGSLPRRGVADFRLVADSVAIVDVSSAMQRDTTGISGALNGELSIQGAAGSPTIELRAALSEGQFGEYRLPLFQMLAHYEAQRLTIKGGLWRDSLRIVTVNGSLPIDLSLRAVESRKLPGPITVVAQSDSLDLEVLDPLIGQLAGMSGQMMLDVRASGTWDSPQYAGFVDVAGGAMTVPALGARYEGLDARLTLQQNVMRIARFQARGGRGVLDMTGTVTFDSLFSARPVLADTLRFTRFSAFDIPEFGSFTGSGELYLHGPLLGATLTGHAVVDEGYLEFADLVRKRIVSLDDPEFRALVDSNLTLGSDLAPAAHTIFFDSLRVRDVSFTMGNDVWLRSSEASIQLAGDFVINREFEDQLPRYRIDGMMRAVRGTYKLVLGFENSLLAISRDFRVVRGTVRFFGTPDFNPEMDIVAEHTARTVQGQPLVVQAVIGGTLMYPTLTLSSDHRPPLSQTEIVSYLMFGVPPSTARGNEGDLGLSVIGGNIVGGIGQALASELGLPLSYLSIQTGSGQAVNSGNVSTARIEAGMQLTERTFVTLNAGLCEVLTSQMIGATLEYRFSTRWTASASFEPVIQQCGTASQLAGLNSRWQAGFDLFWQQGIR